MQPEFLARLSAPVQHHIREVEARAGVAIEVVLEPYGNAPPQPGPDHLAIVIESRRVQLFAPSNGYFPDGAVRHELLHMERFHVSGVPQLRLHDDVPWDEGWADVLGALDNAIEHVVIVPRELQWHPERMAHWEGVMQRVWSDFTSMSPDQRPLAACIHWSFLRHVLPNSQLVPVAVAVMTQYGLLELAEAFAERYLSALDRKEAMVQILFGAFPDLPRDRAALEYLSSVHGTRQTPIT
jgi:hypothetical protein